jgi:hypothetical protein
MRTFLLLCMYIPDYPYHTHIYLHLYLFVNGNQENCSSIKFQARSWIHCYRLLLIKQLRTLLWWSIGPPPPLDPPPMRLKFLGWKCRLLPIFGSIMSAFHVHDIYNYTLLVNKDRLLKKPNSILHNTSISHYSTMYDIEECSLDCLIHNELVGAKFSS